MLRLQIISGWVGESLKLLCLEHKCGKLISIEIPVLHGKYFSEVAESIRSQGFQDFEVIVVNSSDNERVSDIISQYGFKEIKVKARLLKARYLAHCLSKGGHTLLLDETRMLRKDALSILSNLDHEAIIGEQEIGNTFWTKLADLDKENIIECNSPDTIKGLALPRFFRREVLDHAFNALKQNLKDKFDQVIFPDHELIYYEAIRKSRKISLIKDKLIYHYGDRTFLEIVKKYYRYGKSINVLKDTPYRHFIKVKRKQRNICVGNRFLLYILYATRGIPFLIGRLI